MDEIERGMGLVRKGINKTILSLILAMWKRFRPRITREIWRYPTSASECEVTMRRNWLYARYFHIKMPFRYVWWDIAMVCKKHLLRHIWRVKSRNNTKVGDRSQSCIEACEQGNGDTYILSQYCIFCDYIRNIRYQLKKNDTKIENTQNTSHISQNESEKRGKK